MKKEVLDFLKRFEHLAKASSFLTASDVRDAIRMAQAMKLLMGLIVCQFLAAHVDDPVVWQFGADATPVSTRERRSLTLSGKTFQRVGEAKQDFLLQRVFLSCAQHLRWPRQAACVLVARSQVIEL